MTRQYIGARYVPIIDGAWSATKDYEPLTVVLADDGSSYTSRTFVPAGTPLTNNLYWALTGNYNAQVASYEAKVNEYISKNRVIGYDTLSELIDDESLKIGDIAITLGYHTVNDGGASSYIITEADNTADGGTYIDLDNGLQATLVFGNSINVKQYGAYGDNYHDDTESIQNALNNSLVTTVFVPSGQYKTTDTLYITHNNTHVSGEGYNSTQFENCFITGTFNINTGVTGTKFSDFVVETVNDVDAWAFVLNDASFVDIENVDVLGGSFRNTRSGVLKQVGSTWSTLLISHCVFDFGGTANTAVIFENTSGSNRSVDCHLDDVFLDALLCTTASEGCMKVTACNDVNITNCLFRAHHPASCLIVNGGNVINQCSSLQSGSATVIVNSGSYATRNGSENGIQNHSLVNRYDNGLFKLQYGMDWFDKITSTDWFQMTIDGKLMGILRGHNSDNRTEFIAKARTDFNVLSAIIKTNMPAIDNAGVGLLLYDESTQKFMFWGVGFIDNIPNLCLCELTEDAAIDVSSGYHQPCMMDEINLAIEKNSNGLSYGVRNVNGNITKLLYANQALYTFTHVGVVMLMPVSSGIYETVMVLDNLNLS